MSILDLFIFESPLGKKVNSLVIILLWFTYYMDMPETYSKTFKHEN